MEAIKYLGVMFDRNLTMAEHVRRTVIKAEGVANKLARIMPNQGGHVAGRRRVLVFLYGAPIWVNTTKNKSCINLLEGVH
jgi:hypothetical protein